MYICYLSKHAKALHLYGCIYIQCLKNWITLFFVSNYFSSVPTPTLNNECFLNGKRKR